MGVVVSSWTLLNRRLRESPLANLLRRPLGVFRRLRLLIARDALRGAIWQFVHRPKTAFQPRNDSYPDRYAHLFSFVGEQLNSHGAPRLLSFGCSTGEEVFSLRRYFSEATIRGLDINPQNIAVCRKHLRRLGDGDITFDVADSTVGEASASFDAIFCMAVLKHSDLDSSNADRCDHLIRFEDFDRIIADFARCLRPGGLLIMRHTNFRLCDTRQAAHFETIASAPLKHRTPFYGPDNQLLRGVTYEDVVFRKRQ